MLLHDLDGGSLASTNSSTPLFGTTMISIGHLFGATFVSNIAHVVDFLTFGVAIRIMLGASVGIPAASLCINRRLYCIAKVHAVTVTKAEVRIRSCEASFPSRALFQKRRAILIDTLICVFFPMVFLALRE